MKLKPLQFTCVFLSSLVSLNAVEGKPSQPNIVFILADDMGYSDMGWQGSPIQTPNLDKLRAGGMFLSRNYAQPQCSPSRAAFLSGFYPYRYGLQEHIVLPWSLTGLPREVKTIAQKLKEGGYETAVVGKWHVGGHLQSYLPHNRGFDHSFCCINGDMDYWNYRHYDFSDIIQDGKKFYAPTKQAGEDSGNMYATDLWKQHAVELIREHDSKRPLFMYLAFTAPHHPLQAPKQVLEKYSPTTVESYWSGPNTDKGRKANSRRLYMAMVDALDAAIGEVIQSLREKDMLENTLIVFCSDNGGIPEADNRPLRSVKGDSFEGGVRVPGIAFWPGKIKPGTTSSELIHMSDWYPTFAELAGLSVKGEHLDGMSAANVLRGEKGLRQEVPIVSEGRHALITRQYALVGGGADYQKLLNENLSKFELFDLDADVAQKNPTRANPEIAQRMRQVMATHLQNSNRGYFDWDITYTKDRITQRKGDHNFDSVVNDLPNLTTEKKAGQTTVTISPVSKELDYHLQSSPDGKTWNDIADYVSKTDTTQYAFAPCKAGSESTQYRVQTELHLGLPVREAFSLGAKYKIGDIVPASIPVIDGFLSRSDVTGRVEIIDQNLAYSGWPREGGALQLAFGTDGLNGSFTRYFIEPHSRGKLYASMLVQFRASEPECAGQINWLRQEGWNGPTRSSANLSFQSDGICLDLTDPVGGHTTQRLATYEGEVVCVVFEFDLSTTGKDSLKVFLNPDLGAPILHPVASFLGEFTVDRLRFAVTGRPGSRLTIDELRLGTRLEDVMPNTSLK